MEMLVERGVIEKVNRTSTGGHILVGPAIQTDIRNNNGRIYPSSLVDPVVNTYIREFVSRGRAVGEIIHPDEKALDRIDYREVCIKIIGLEKDGKDWIGKYSPIIGAPRGDLVQALVDNEVLFATSSRARGTTDKTGKVTAFRLITVADIEYAPGAPDAFAQVLTEGLITEKAFASDQAYEFVLEAANANNLILAFKTALDNMLTKYRQS